MMKRLLVFVQMLIAFAAGVSAEETLTVCNGTNTNADLPFAGVYNQDGAITSQMIYPAADLAAMNGKKITSITFYPTSALSWTNTDTWKLAEVDQTTFSSSALLSPTMTQVASTRGTKNADNSWTITFDAPYVYNGGNLMIQGEMPQGYDGNQSFYGVNQSGYTSVVKYNDWGTWDTSRVRFLPKVKFTYEENAGGGGSTTAVFDFGHNPWNATLGSYFDGKSLLASDGATSISFDKGTASTSVTYKQDGAADSGTHQMRVYAGSTATITAPDGMLISKIEFTYNGTNDGGYGASLDLTEPAATYTLAPTSNARWITITVTLEAAGGGDGPAGGYEGPATFDFTANPWNNEFGYVDKLEFTDATSGATLVFDKGLGSQVRYRSTTYGVYFYSNNEITLTAPAGSAISAISVTPYANDASLVGIANKDITFDTPVTSYQFGITGTGGRWTKVEATLVKAGGNGGSGFEIPEGYAETADWAESFEKFAYTINANSGYGLGWEYIDNHADYVGVFSRSSSYKTSGSYSVMITNTSTYTNVDYLVTPALKGAVSLKARASSSASSYNGTQYIKFYKVTKDSEGKFSVPTEKDLIKVEDLGTNNTFHDVEVGNFDDYTYVAITGSRVYIDDLTADYAVMPENPALQITSITSETSESNPIYADASGKAKWTGKIKVKNTGNVDLVAGRDNYSVTVTSQSTSSVTIPETIIPISVDLAQGEESDEITIEVDCQIVNLANGDGRTAIRATSNTIEYGVTATDSKYYKQSVWFYVKNYAPRLSVRDAAQGGGKLDSYALPYGLVSGSSAKKVTITNEGGSDAIITAINTTIPEGFSHTAELPLTIAKGETTEIDLIIGGEDGYKEGTLTFVYNDGREYVTKLLSATVIKEGTFLETFGTILSPAKDYVPGGWINQGESNWEANASSSNVYMQNTVQQYPTAMLVSPKLTFAEGDKMTVGATSRTTSFYSSTDAYLQVYYSTDRKNWTLANVITYDGTKKSATEDVNGNAIDASKVIEWGKLSGTSVTNIKAYTIDGIPAGDYFIGFRSGYALIDYVFGGKVTNVENDLYIAKNLTVEAANPMVNYPVATSATYYNMTPHAAAPHTVCLYDGDSLLVERKVEDLDAFAKYDFSFTFYPREAKELKLCLVMKNVEGEYGVKTDTIKLAIAEEEYTPEILAGSRTSTTNAYVPGNLNYYNSRSEWYWCAEDMGLKEGDIITSISFPYYNESKDLVIDKVELYLENTENSEFANGCSFTDVSELKPVFAAENYTWKKAGTSSNHSIVTFQLAEPFEYTGGNLHAMMFNEDPDKTNCSSYKFECYSKTAGSSIYAYNDTYDTYVAKAPARNNYVPVAIFGIKAVAPVFAGTVTNDISDPVEGVVVNVTKGGVLYSDTTDVNGKFKMDIKQPQLGDFDIAVLYEGYHTSEYPAAITFTADTTKAEYQLVCDEVVAYEPKVVADENGENVAVEIAFGGLYDKVNERPIIVFASEFLHAMGAAVDVKSGYWQKANDPEAKIEIKSDNAEINKFCFNFSDYELTEGDYTVVFPRGFFVYLDSNNDFVDTGNDVAGARRMAKSYADAKAGKVQTIMLDVTVSGGVVTGINKVALDDNTVIYDLQGRKINVNDAKGVIILNGKKVVK